VLARFLHQEKGPLQVYIEQAPKILRSTGKDIAKQRETGIGDRKVKVTKRIYRPMDQLTDHIHVSRVPRVSDGLPSIGSNLSYGLLSARRIDVVHHNRRSLKRELPGNGQADSRTGTSNHGGFVLEGFGHRRRGS
jgi:hypothetical protein